jgi:hypothetical protein
MTENSDDEKRRRHDYDQRQYRRMVERVEAFEAGALHIDGMRADLATLLMALEEEPDGPWADEYSKLCNELDAIWSIAGVEKNKVLTREDQRRAHEIAVRLKQIVLRKIDREKSCEGDC